MSFDADYIIATRLIRQLNEAIEKKPVLDKHRVAAFRLKEQLELHKKELLKQFLKESDEADK